MRVALAVTALLALPGPMSGQAVPDDTGRRHVAAVAQVRAPAVMPGAVATSPVSLVAPSGARRGAYRIVPSAGVRLFSEAVGELELRGGDSTQVPITYGVPRTYPAGSAIVAQILVRWDDSSTWTGDLVAEVRARRALRLALHSDDGLAFRGRAALLRLLLSNGGNAADTVALQWSAGGDWLLGQAPLMVVVGAGQTVVTTVTLRCPSTAAIGEVHIAQVTALGRGGALTASAALRVAYAPASSPGFVEAPTTIFVGSTLQDGWSAQPSFAVSSSAQVTPSTELSLIAHRRERNFLDPVLTPELGGQTFHLGLHNGPLRAAVGDVWQPGSALTGLVAQGAGVDLAWTDSSLQSKLLVARQSFGRPQRVAYADASIRRGPGRLGLSTMLLRRNDAELGDSSSVTSAGVTYKLGTHGPGFFGAELGAIRLDDARGRVTTGLGLDIGAEHATDDDAFSARAHVVPASSAARDLLPTSMFVSASHAMSPSLRAQGTGSMTSLTLETGTLRSAGVSAGASFALGAAHATLLGNLHRVRGSGTTVVSTDGRGASASLTFPLWFVTFDGYAEHGLALAGDTAATSDVLRAGVRWSGVPGWFWAGVVYGRSLSGSLSRSTEASGAYRLGRVEMQGGTNALVAPRLSLVPDPGRLDAANELQVASFWSRLAVRVTGDLSIVAGTSYQQHALDSPWRFSLGVERRLSMPVPVRRAPLAQGVVFEDRDGDREWDQGEPTVSGITISLGLDRVVTRDDGAFAFLDPSSRGQPLVVDGASVPIGYLLPPDVAIANHGRVNIPLVRSASITLALFADANADSARNDAASLPLPDGVFVTLSDSAGRTLEGAPDASGAVVFPALLPGRFTITIHLPPSGPRAAITRSFEIEVAPAEHVRRDVPLPVLRREIRFDDRSR